MYSQLKTTLRDPEDRIVLCLCLFLVVSTAAVYAQTVTFGFVDYDDADYVSNNPKVPAGLTLDGVKWAFTTMHGSNWIPLVWLSLMLDRQLFGLGAGGFHAVNVMLHIANSLLLFVVLKKCTRALWPSFFVAAFFALHPLHVESVAWVTERKDVLSTLFWMLTMLAYIRYAERKTILRYSAIIVVFALGLMAKPMLVTLPFVLLLMDYWPLGRICPEAGQTGEPLLRPLFEKVPLFALSVLSSVITYIAQETGGAMSRLSAVPLGYRVSNALVAYVGYILKMFWPLKLAVFYPHPAGSIPAWKIAAAVVALAAITVAAVLLRRRRYLPVGWFWYLGTLVPVIGLVQVGSQAMADRYMYVPLTGIFIILVWSISDAIAASRPKKLVAGSFAWLLIVVLALLTYRQVSYWRNTITLFEHAIAVTTNNYVAHGNLGVSYAERGDLDAAMRQFEIVMKIMPKDADTLYNVAKGLALQGRTDDALKMYDRVLALVPGDAETCGALALMEANNGNFEKAVELYKEGIEQNPKDADLRRGLGSLYLKAGRIDEAIAELQTAVNLKAASPIYCDLGLALMAKGDNAGAIECFSKAVYLDPANAEAHYNLGNSYLGRNQLALAAAEYEKAIAIRPDYAKACGNLAITLAQMGRLNEAITYFSKVAALEPNSVEAHFNLAHALAGKGDTAGAIEQLRRVVELAPLDADARCLLADLLARQGNREEAAAEYKRVLEIAPQHPQALTGLKQVNP